MPFPQEAVIRFQEIINLEIVRNRIKSDVFPTEFPTNPWEKQWHINYF
jgi:hypothetical protein